MGKKCTPQSEGSLLLPSSWLVTGATSFAHKEDRLTLLKEASLGDESFFI